MKATSETTMRNPIRVLLAVPALAALLVWSGCETAVPAPCQLQPSGNGGYAVQFTLDGGTAGCPAQFGDWWGFDPYINLADPSKGPLIIAVSSQSTYPDPPSATDPIYSKGTFDSVNPLPDQTCKMASMTPMTTKLYNPPGDLTGTVTGTFTYALSNMTWLETALYLGTQWEGTVHYTSSTGCNGTYSARAITPPLVCTKKSDCDPSPTDPTVAPSGINPAYNTTCDLSLWAQQVAALITGSAPDPTVGICFFAEPFPATTGFKR